MCVQQKKNQDNQYKLRLYDEKKTFKRENNNRNILVYKSNKTDCLYWFFFKER